MRNSNRTYLPAASYDWLLPLYDPFVKLVGFDSDRGILIDQAGLQANDRILDIGCGTGSLLQEIKQLHPKVEAVGIDPDIKAIGIAARKFMKAGIDIWLDHGFSGNLPYADASFDCVFSSFMLHHLQADQKEKTLFEALRVLKPGASIHLLDFSHSELHSGRGKSFFFRKLHSNKHLKGNSEEQIISLMDKVGFAAPARVHEKTRFFIRTVWYQAFVPLNKGK